MPLARCAPAGPRRSCSTTFPADLGEVALVPGTGGVFTVRLDDDVLWDRKEQDGFPELAGSSSSYATASHPTGASGHSDRR